MMVLILGSVVFTAGTCLKSTILLVLNDHDDLSRRNNVSYLDDQFGIVFKYYEFMRYWHIYFFYFHLFQTNKVQESGYKNTSKCDHIKALFLFISVLILIICLRYFLYNVCVDLLACVH